METTHEPQPRPSLASLGIDIESTYEDIKDNITASSSYIEIILRPRVCGVGECFTTHTIIRALIRKV